MYNIFVSFPFSPEDCSIEQKLWWLYSPVPVYPHHQYRALYKIDG